MALTILNGPVIAAGESLSDGINCTAGQIARFTMPAGWTNANITFAISSDGNGYNDLFDADGKEITMTVVAGSAVVVAQFEQFFRAIAFIKIRSGTRAYPVVQQERREFSIALLT